MHFEFFLMERKMRRLDFSYFSCWFMYKNKLLLCGFDYYILNPPVHFLTHYIIPLNYQLTTDSLHSLTSVSIHFAKPLPTSSGYKCIQAACKQWVSVYSCFCLPPSIYLSTLLFPTRMSTSNRNNLILWHPDTLQHHSLFAIKNKPKPTIYMLLVCISSRPRKGMALQSVWRPRCKGYLVGVKNKMCS